MTMISRISFLGVSLFTLQAWGQEVPPGSQIEVKTTIRVLPSSRARIQSLRQDRLAPIDRLQQQAQGPGRSPLAPPSPLSDLQAPDSSGVGQASAPESEREGVPPALGSGQDRLAGGDLPGYASGVYSPVELIVETLTDGARMGDFGERLNYYNRQIPKIVQVSDHNYGEKSLRFVMNRTLDLAEHFVPTAGNEEELQRLMVNFYRYSFDLAAAMGNNHVAIEGRGQDFLNASPKFESAAEAMKRISLARFGYSYATHVWRYQHGLTSNSSKALLLMRASQYLGQDLTNDLHSREKPIQQMINRVRDFQYCEAYENALAAMSQDHEPADRDLAILRDKFFTILQKMPNALAAAGIAAWDSQGKSDPLLGDELK